MGSNVPNYPITTQHNFFSGSIPPEFADMDHLAFVDLSFNRLTGTVPSTIAEKYKLEVFALEGNAIDATPEEEARRRLLADQAADERNVAIAKKQAYKQDLIDKGFAELIQSDSDTEQDGDGSGGGGSGGGGGGAEEEEALGGHYPMMVLRRGTILKLDSLPSHEEAKRRYIKFRSTMWVPHHARGS